MSKKPAKIPESKSAMALVRLVIIPTLQPTLVPTMSGTMATAVSTLVPGFTAQPGTGP